MSAKENGLQAVTDLTPEFVEEEATYSISETLNNYFSSVGASIDGSSKDSKSKGELDYKISKRFLITSYNNLKSLDPALHDHKEIKEKLKELRDLQKSYDTVNDKTNVPQLAFEVMFLRVQPEYLQYLKDKEDMLSRISVLTTTCDSLGPQIKSMEAEIKKLHKNDDTRIKMENDIKPLRGRYVDSVHEKAELTKEFDEMVDIKSLYTEKYYDSFVQQLEELSGEYKKVLSKILNHKAYELDYSIWEHASKSKLIREYFFDAGIEGDYSTKTFLRYYLGTLDKKQLGYEQKELFKLMEYLEKKQKE